MALNKDLLKTSIKAAFKAQTTKTDNPDGALDDLATMLAAAIDVYVKAGEVTGSCATPAGIGTITGKVI